MKTRTIILLTFLLSCSTLTAYSQDVIVQRNGEEISAKVLEVKLDLITYKNWTNIDGPTYSKAKSEIFMIKYANGTKDVFEVKANTNNDPPNNIVNTSSDLYIGNWYPKNYNGNGIKTVLIITKALNNYLVEYKVHEQVDANFYSTDGSFKEVGSLEKGSIIINMMMKLTLLNENSLLMGSKEFYKSIPGKTPVSGSSSSSSNTSNSQVSSVKKIAPSYKGDQVNGKNEGKGKMVYSDGAEYNGDWKNNMRNGFGVLSYGNGEIYTGYWKDGKRDSTGVMQYAVTEIGSHPVFTGTYKNDEAYNGRLYSGGKFETFVIDGVWGKPKKIKK